MRGILKNDFSRSLIVVGKNGLMCGGIVFDGVGLAMRKGAEIFNPPSRSRYGGASHGMPKYALSGIRYLGRTFGP